MATITQSQCDALFPEQVKKYDDYTTFVTNVTSNEDFFNEEMMKHLVQMLKESQEDLASRDEVIRQVYYLLGAMQLSMEFFMADENIDDKEAITRVESIRKANTALYAYYTEERTEEVVERVADSLNDVQKRWEEANEDMKEIGKTMEQMTSSFEQLGDTINIMIFNELASQLSEQLRKIMEGDDIVANIKKCLELYNNLSTKYESIKDTHNDSIDKIYELLSTSILKLIDGCLHIAQDDDHKCDDPTCEDHN